MGYESDQFISPPDQELICPLCYGVLEDPVQGTVCDHLFCRSCVQGWLNQTSRCPVDRRFTSQSQLRSPPKIIINLINRLEIKCLYEKDGCDWIIRLGDLDEHMSWCPFNPRHPESDKLRAENPSPLRQLRVMANFEQDFSTIKESIGLLSKDFNLQKELAKKFNDNFDRFGEMILDLEEQFKRVTDPLMEYICKDYKSKPMEGGKRHRSESLESISTHRDRSSSSTHSSDTVVRTISISNLNEFICENVLSEFLRQNNIYVAKCIPSIGYNERSRNFQVIVRESDLDKILVPDLWPRGVTLSLRDGISKPKEAVHGRREKNLPGVVITSGMSYWHS